MTHVTMRAELAQAILNYLGTQPYSHVHQMIGELQRCQPTQEDSAEGLSGPKLVKDEDAS